MLSFIYFSLPHLCICFVFLRLCLLPCPHICCRGPIIVIVIVLLLLIFNTVCGGLG